MGADALFLWFYFTDVSLTVTFIPNCVWPQEKKKKKEMMIQQKEKNSLRLHQQMPPNLHLFPVLLLH